MEAGHWWRRGGDACQSQHGQIALRAAHLHAALDEACHGVISSSMRTAVWGGRPVFFSQCLSLSTFSCAVPFISPSNRNKRQPREVERKSAADGGKCKLLHLKRQTLEFDGERFPRSLPMIYPAVFWRKCGDLHQTSRVCQDRQPVERMAFADGLMRFFLPAVRINDWTRPLPETQIQSITHHFWQIYRAINATAKSVNASLPNTFCVLFC